MYSKPFPTVGGYDFPRDPNLPSDEHALFWLPEFQPAAILLTAWLERHQQGEAGFDWTSLPGIDLRPAGDGWHALWPRGGGLHQFWFPEQPQPVTDYAAVLPLDDFFELRVHAARRLWRALRGKPIGDPFSVLPKLARHRHVLRIRVLDARLAGASYRTIAEVMFDYHVRGKRTDWENHPLKNYIRRLSDTARYFMLGGYRTLIYYPINPTRRRR